MFEGEKIILRGLELSDVDEIMKHWNKKETRRFINSQVPHSAEEEKEWVKSTWEQRRTGTNYVFAILIKETNLFIGIINLSIINQISRRGAIGVVIFNQDYLSKGYGSEALTLLLNFTFNTLNLHSAELGVLEDNTRAQRCYDKVGFQRNGRKRQVQYYGGKYYDIIEMDILAREFRERSKKV